MKILNYFKDTPYGTLFIDDVLFKFDSIPVIFTLKSAESALFLGYCSEVCMLPKYIFVRTTDTVIQSLKSGALSYYHAFKLAEEVCIFLIYNRDKHISLSKIVNINDIDSIDIPAPNVFYGKESLNDYESTDR